MSPTPRATGKAANAMGKEFWTVCIAIICIFWGTAVLVTRHHPSTLIPILGSFLPTIVIGLLVARFVIEKRKR